MSCLFFFFSKELKTKEERGRRKTRAKGEESRERKREGKNEEANEESNERKKEQRKEGRNHLAANPVKDLSCGKPMNKVRLFT